MTEIGICGYLVSMQWNSWLFVFSWFPYQVNYTQSTLNCFCSSGDNDKGAADHTITHKAAINSSMPWPLLTLELLPGMTADHAKHPNPPGLNQHGSKSICMIYLSHLWIVSCLHIPAVEQSPKLPELVQKYIDEGVLQKDIPNKLLDHQIVSKAGFKILTIKCATDYINV